MVRSFQTDLFGQDILDRFVHTQFTKSNRANRMGIALDFEGEPFQAPNQLNILSEIIAVGDIQMTGDGRPFILMNEAQTTGGYPRLGTVLNPDLRKIAQALPGTTFSFKLLNIEDAQAFLVKDEYNLAHVNRHVTNVVYDVTEITTLHEYNLVSGFVSALDEGDKHEY